MRYNSFEGLCQAKGLDPETILPDVSRFAPQHQMALLNTAKLYLLVEEMNGDWKPDWNTLDEKWYPWFDLEVDARVNPSGFRFNGADCYYAASSVGSRLCFRSRKDAEFAGQTWTELYRGIMILE